MRSGVKALERKILLERYGKWLWVLRQMPDHAAHFLAGIVIPPHERLWLKLFFSDYKENTVVASRGTSKCGKLGTVVIMADGTRRKIEEVRRGESVMGPDGKPRTVLDTTRGYGKLYEVRQTSGMDYVVNDAHILSLKNKRGEVVNLPVEDFLYARYQVKQSLRGYRAGLLPFPKQDVTVDPYFLGLWLGDGCGRNPVVYTMDPEIIRFLQEYAASMGLTAVIKDLPHTVAKKVRIRANGGPAGNPFWKALKAYGVTNPAVGKGTNNKHIPDAYLVNDEATRLALLAGLLDSDGTVSKKGYVITQTNERLARDIKYLADTLGFRTSLKQIKTTCSYGAGTTWRVGINGDVWRIPCRLPRKQLDRKDYHSNKDKLLSMVDVVPAGEGEWAGFTVDGDHLFLLEDGTVTHNSFVHASLAAPLKGLLYKNLGILLVSASGFRGSKLLMEDSKRLITGQLKSQRLEGEFMVASCKSGRKVVKQEPDRHTIYFDTNSTFMGVPTNNPDNLRGIRANIAIVDERNTFPGEAVQKVVRPILNVGGDFLRTGTGGDKNQLFQVSTIDYSTRDWFPEIEEARRKAQKQYEAQHALQAGDWDRYDALMKDRDYELHSASFSYSRFDYTDLLIPEFIIDEDTGEKFKVNYPYPDELEESDLLQWDERERMRFWYTYPVDKKGLEEPRRNYTMDEGLWLAEQRNVPITDAGAVFPHGLIVQISEKPVYERGKLPGNIRYTTTDADGTTSEEDFHPPLLMSCGDPCVLGVDYARESDQFAIVVIRLGELAEGEFDPHLLRKDEKGRPLMGRTAWNHVCWAESWSRWTAQEAANRIRELYEKFHIIRTLEVPGIALDKRGGGGAVRDELAQPKPPLIGGKPDSSWTEPVKIYDPEDEDYAHYKAYSDPHKYWGGLRLVATTNMDNTDWTTGTRAMMETKKLYIARWKNESDWVVEHNVATVYGTPDKSNPDYHRWRVGYAGIQMLKMQLLKLQMKPTPTGLIRYIMPGVREKEEGKKDLYSALIYGVSLAREHLVYAEKNDHAAPMVEPILVNIGVERPIDSPLNPFSMGGWSL